MVSSILIILAAIFNATMDRLENESFHASIFKEWNPKFWYKRVSWTNKHEKIKIKIPVWILKFGKT